jgi:hypothetical protein
MEKTLLFRNDLGVRCTAGQTLSGIEERGINLETQLSSEKTQVFPSFSSKAYRIVFGNQSPKQVRFTLTSSGNNTQFTVYRAASNNPNRLINCPDASELTNDVLEGKPVTATSNDVFVIFVSNASASASEVKIQMTRDLQIQLQAQGPYNGPAQMCARVKASFEMEDLPLTLQDQVQIKYFIDSKPAETFGVTSTGPGSLVNFTRSCNLSEGTHTLEARIISSDGTTFGSASSSFVVENNLWPGRYINGTDRCAGISASTLSVNKTNPPESFTVLPGESTGQLRYGGQTTTYDVRYPDGSSFVVVKWVFPIPFDGDPQSYGYFQNVAHWLSCGTPPDFHPGVPPSAVFLQGVDH